jgi:hypothetical protein
MTISTSQRTEREEKRAIRITVPRGPAAWSRLSQFQEHMDLSKADLVSCAITWYAHFGTQLRAGYKPILRKDETGEAYGVREADGIRAPPVWGRHRRPQTGNMYYRRVSRGMESHPVAVQPHSATA